MCLLGQGSAWAGLTASNTALLGAAEPVGVVVDRTAEGTRVVLPAAALLTVTYVYVTATVQPTVLPRYTLGKTRVPLEGEGIMAFGGLSKTDLLLRRLG